MYSFLATDGASVYFATSSELMKLPVAGGAAKGIWTSTGSPARYMADVVLDGNSIYWTSGGSGAIRVMRLWPR